VGYERQRGLGGASEPASLHGPIVSLEPLARSRLPRLTAIGLDAELWRLQARAIQSAADMEDYIEQALSEQARELSLPFVIVRRTDRAVVGSTRFMGIAPAHRRLEIDATWLANAS